MTEEKRCPFMYFSDLSQPVPCVKKDGHEGPHSIREIFPPPQVYPKTGWYKP